MVQSPSWEANWFAASQEIPRISGNPKVHYRTHKRPPPVSILGQPNPVHIHTSNLLEIHLNIIHPSTPESPQWSLSLRFPHQDPIHPISSPIRATCPAQLIRLDFITRTILQNSVYLKHDIDESYMVLADTCNKKPINVPMLLHSRRTRPTFHFCQPTSVTPPSLMPLDVRDLSLVVVHRWLLQLLNRERD